jgi:hypothetical protein
MYSKFFHLANNVLLIPSASFTIFELGKNYNNIKNSIQNNITYKKMLNNIIDKPLFK